MTSFFQRWDRWWCRQVHPHALAIFRILFGGYLFVWLLSYLPHTALLFSNEGFVQTRFAHQPIMLPDWLIVPPDPFTARIIFIAFLITLLCFTLGALWRIAAPLVVLFCLYYWQLHVHIFMASFHRIFFLTLLVLACSNAHRTFSVDMWRKHGSFFAWKPISILPQRLLAAQITMTYFVVGWQKSFLPDWKGGEMMAYSYISKWGTFPAYELIRLNLPMWFYDAQVKLVKLFEYLLPFGLWIRKAQKWAFLGGLLFHTFITIFLAIWWFMIVPAYYLLFVSPEVVYDFCKRHSGGRIR